MTFSIVARQGSSFGVAVASKFLAVGAVVPAAVNGVGAVATQASARVAYLDELVEVLRSGAAADDALESATRPDGESATRQLGVVGVSSAATFTGAECIPWAGGVAHDEGESAYAIQGNILTGPEVVAAMEASWRGSAGRPFAQRLLAALVAGDDAGGDSRGRQSAAMYAVEPGAGYDACGVLADLRVDDHGDPVGELGRLLSDWEMYFGRPEDVQALEGPLAEEVRGLLAGTGFASDDLAAALADWAGQVNYEARLTPDGVDARVLEALRATRR
ncbi:MAG: DUF1028 domain-containing protein [Humibacillus sp.]|nr:DUF1028 domain-containing protein [Humibacillus sp.]MDN5777641.1 DUF1028 domain-containing protein [Humibacillus sp.]